MSAWGLYGATSGAASAMTTNTAYMSNPMDAYRSPRATLQATRSASRQVAVARAHWGHSASRSPPLMAHPRVEHAVEHVGHEVHDDHDDRDEEKRRLRHRGVFGGNCSDQRAAQSRPGKHGLHDDVTADGIPDPQGKRRHHGQQRVAGRVPQQDAAFGQPA